MVHYIDPLIGLHFPIACDDFEAIIIVMKTQYTFACHLLVIKLKCKFSNRELIMFLGSLPTIQVITNLWVHFSNSYELDQMTLPYTQEI
jgi:hypothetical protein